MKDKLINFMQKDNWVSIFAHITTACEILELKQYLWEITNFLPETAKTRQRGWHVTEDKYTVIMCEFCQTNPVKFDTTYVGYRVFCSPKCASNSPKVKEKIAGTSMEKYGTTCSLLNDEQKVKRANTLKEKYGTEHFSQAESVKEKKRRTSMKRFGVEYGMQHPDVIARRDRTVREKYGVDYVTQLQDFKEQTKKTNILKYGEESYTSTPEFKERYRRKSRERYGTDHPHQSQVVKDQMKASNRIKYGRDYSTQQHISEDSIVLLNDSEWLRMRHHTDKLELCAIADQLGVHPDTVGKKCKALGIETKRYYTSTLEREIRTFLEEHVNGDLSYGNRKILDSNFELDIYSPENGIAVEFNGLFWHSEFQLDKNYHYEKYKNCKDRGIRLIQIFEDEWNQKKDIVKNKLLYMFGKSKQMKVFARKTRIVNVDTTNKKLFLENNHIQGNGNSSVNYGLEHDDQLVAVMSFKKNSDEVYELNRYATSGTVVGGFSKLLKHFENEYNCPKIITFADLRWSEGELYSNNGFTLEKLLHPDYYWIKRDKRFHKFNFRHKQLKDCLKKYDPKLSESENMHANNWWRIYDAGKLRFAKN